MRQLAAALKVIALCVCLIVAGWLAFGLIATWSDCPSCWPPSSAYPDYPLLFAALVTDLVVMVLVAKSLTDLPKPKHAAD